jgi:hypothetical protein
MNSTAFSLLANSNPELDGNQEMELTIGSLSIIIGPSGSSRLSDSTKSDASANKPEAEETWESSEDSSSEVNSPVSFDKAPIAEGDKIWENFDSEERACQTHNTKDFAVGSNGVSKVHQLCVIIIEAEEENKSEGSKKIDRLVDKMKEHNKKEKEKVHVSAGEWRMIKLAINHGTEVPEGSRREVLMGYQYALYQHRKKLREERDMVFQDNNSMSREEYWEDHSEDSEYSRERHGDPKHNRGVTARSREERYSRSLTPQPEEEEDDFIQETPEAALVAAQAYLLTTRPEPGDPREDMHRTAIRSLGIVESKIREKGPDIKSTRCKENQKEKFRYDFASNEHSNSLEEERRQKRKEDARNIIAQARVNKSRHAWREENYEDDDTSMGVMTHKYRGSQQSSREVLPKFIDSIQGEPKNICKP